MIVLVQDYLHYYCYYTFLSIIIGILCFFVFTTSISIIDIVLI